MSGVQGWIDPFQFVLSARPQFYRRPYTIARALGRFRFLSGWPQQFHPNNDAYVGFTSGLPDSEVVRMTGLLQNDPGRFEEFLVLGPRQIWIVRRWFLNHTWNAELGPDHGDTLQFGYPSSLHTGTFGIPSPIDPSAFTNTTVPVFQDMAPSVYLRFEPGVFINDAFSVGGVQGPDFIENLT